MMKRKALFTLMAASMLTIGGGTLIHAAFDENLNMYTLDAVVVEADKTKNKFGDTITEQSYYRTGGDVKVITREEIEKRHYTDVTEAIKRIPGVAFSNPGYRGGEYGYNTYNNSMSINGDSRVVILVDGRRVDNSSGARFGAAGEGGNRNMTDLNQVVSMEAVDKIEVIKGPGASAYGSDATGGVINIITRKGEVKNTGTIDLATGSWNKHVYNLSYSGSAGDDHSWKYFISASRQMAGDSKYHDELTNKDYTYQGTSYKDEGVNFHVTKDFDDNHGIDIWYNHQNGLDHYPITAPDYRYWSQTEWDRIIQGTVDGYYSNVTNPGYRNLFVLDALSGSYNAYRNNDIDVKYTFDRSNGMESFVRVYNQSHHYWGVDRYPDWTSADYATGFVPFPGGPEWDEFIKNYPFKRGLNPTRTYDEKNRGIQLQVGKSYGIHDVLASVTYDKAKTFTNSYQKDTDTYRVTHVERKSVFGYVQDKMHLTDKWDFTPALRYGYYSTYTNSTEAGTADIKGSSSVTKITPTINTEYAFSDTLNAYAGWTKVYRPVNQKDASLDPVKNLLNGIPLSDEKGNVWTIGIKKELSNNTTIAVHYDWTQMDNAITRYAYWNKDKKKFESKYVNAENTKKSFNITVDTQLDSHWNLGLGYSYADEHWDPKSGQRYDPAIGIDDPNNVKLMINSYRPANHYTANLSYECGKWYSGLLLNYYTGMSSTAFTNTKPMVLDWNLNYEATDDLTLYTTVTNLTNEGYENAYSTYNGMGAAPQPGRAWMVGARYKF